MAAATSLDTVTAGEPMDDSGGWLDAGWAVLPAETLPGLPGEPRAGERRFVLLHPAHGIAILDLWASVAALPELEVAASLDAELALAGFLRRHDPRLPVRRIYLAQAALPQLTRVVARAYAGTPPLDLPEGWIDAVRGSLAVPQKPAGRMPRLRMAGRYRLAAGIAALLTVGAAGLLATGGHVTGQRAQPVAEAGRAPGGTAPAPATTLAVAVPEPAPAAPVPSSPAAAPQATGAPDPAPAPRPDPARAAAAPAPLGPALYPAPPPAAAPAPAMPADPARFAEGTPYGPVAAAPRSVRQQARPVRRAAPARHRQGQVPDSGGSFIRQQSQQYATGNGS